MQSWRILRQKKGGDTSVSPGIDQEIGRLGGKRYETFGAVQDKLAVVLLGRCREFIEVKAEARLHHCGRTGCEMGTDITAENLRLLLVRP